MTTASFCGYDLSRETMSLQIDKFAAIISVIVENYRELFDSSQLSDAQKNLLLQYREKNQMKVI